MRILIKILFISCLSVIVISNSYAQPEIGVYAGYSSSNLKGDKPDKSMYKSKPGIKIGINLDIPLGEYLVLSFQPGFVSGGTRIAFEDTENQTYTDSVTIKLNNFSLPVLLKITSLSPRIYFIGGFDFLFPTKSTAEIGDESFDLSEDVNNLQISIVFGLGYRVPLKRSKLYFELRYEQGLVNITDVPNPVTSYIPRVKPVAIQLLVGWQIPFKKSK